MEHCLRVLIILLVVTAMPTTGSACDWLVSSDVFAMASSAEQVLVVRAEDASTAAVTQAVATSPGVTPSTRLTVGATSCDPRLEAGVSYLAFRSKDGGPVSDRSLVMLIGESGKALVSAVASWRGASDDERADLLESLAPRLSKQPPVDGCERPWATRLAGDAAVAARRLGGRVERLANAFEHAAFGARPMPKTGLTHPTENWLTLLDRADNVALVVAEPGNVTRTVAALKGRPATQRQRLTLSLHPGEVYLIASKRTGALVHPGGWVRVVGAAGERLLDATRTWIAATGDRRQVVESLARRELMLRPSHALVCSASSRWRLGRDLLSRLVELVDVTAGQSVGALESTTCKVLAEVLRRRPFHDPFRAWWRDTGFQSCSPID